MRIYHSPPSEEPSEEETEAARVRHLEMELMRAKAIMAIQFKRDKHPWGWRHFQITQHMNEAASIRWNVKEGWDRTEIPRQFDEAAGEYQKQYGDAIHWIYLWLTSGEARKSLEWWRTRGGPPRSAPPAPEGLTLAFPNEWVSPLRRHLFRASWHLSALRMAVAKEPRRREIRYKNILPLLTQLLERAQTAMTAMHESIVDQAPWPPASVGCRRVEIPIPLSDAELHAQLKAPISFPLPPPIQSRVAFIRP